jgi:hypothetical protein
MYLRRADDARRSAVAATDGNFKVMVAIRLHRLLLCSSEFVPSRGCKWARILHCRCAMTEKKKKLLREISD